MARHSGTTRYYLNDIDLYGPCGQWLGMFCGGDNTWIEIAYQRDGSWELDCLCIDGNYADGPIEKLLVNTIRLGTESAKHRAAINDLIRTAWGEHSHAEDEGDFRSHVERETA